MKCKNCKWWGTAPEWMKEDTVFLGPFGPDVKFCGSKYLNGTGTHEMPMKVSAYSMEEIYTGENFGCIYFAELIENR